MKTKKKASGKTGKKARKKAGKKTNKKTGRRTSKKKESGTKRKRTWKNDETVKMSVQAPEHREKKGRLLVNIGKVLFLVAALAAFWYFFDRWLGRK